MAGPLAGIRILDFTRAQQGPHATVMLADMGAEILKVEAPGSGDARTQPGVTLAADNIRPYFIAHDRGKKSITIDLRHPQGKEAVLRLVRVSDVSVNNFRPGVMDRLGFGYETFRSINPGIIYAAASGWGTVGPLANVQNADYEAQAYGGHESITGTAESGPLFPGAALADQTASIMLALSIAAAVYARSQTGQGQRIDTSLVGGQVALQHWELTEYLAGGREPARAGRTQHLRHGVWHSFQAADRAFATGGVTDATWPVFCQAIGRLDLVGPFRTADLRAAQISTLILELDRTFASRPAADWVEAIRAAGVPAQIVNHYHELAEDPQVRANGYLTTIEHDVLGTVPIVGPPVRLSETPADPSRRPPHLGEHSREILALAGYADDEAEAILASGAVR